MDSDLPLRRRGNVMQIDYADCILRRLSVDQTIQSATILLETADRPQLLLNLKDVEYLSSAGLGMLVTLDKHAKARGGQMRVCELSPTIRGVLQVTRLVDVLTLDATVEEALAHFA